MCTVLLFVVSSSRSIAPLQLSCQSTTAILCFLLLPARLYYYFYSFEVVGLVRLCLYPLTRTGIPAYSSPRECMLSISPGRFIDYPVNHRHPAHIACMVVGQQPPPLSVFSLLIGLSVLRRLACSFCFCVVFLTLALYPLSCSPKSALLSHGAFMERTIAAFEPCPPLSPLIPLSYLSAIHPSHVCKNHTHTFILSIKQ